MASTPEAKEAQDYPAEDELKFIIQNARVCVHMRVCTHTRNRL